MLFQLISIRKKQQSNPVTMDFYFENNQLMMCVLGQRVSFEDFSNETWNDCMRELMVFGINKDTLSNCSVNYGRIMSETKHLVLAKRGVLGVDLTMKIIREITKCATAHLEFVIQQTNLTTSRLRNTGKKSAFISVEK